MSHVCGGEVILVHLLLQLFDRRVNEECGMAAAGAAPDDVWWRAVVPGCGFCDDAGGFGSEGEVGADIVEALH